VKWTASVQLVSNLLLVLVLCGVAFAQTTSEIMIGQRILEPIEASRYESVMTMIEQRLGQNITVTQAKGSIGELLREVDHADLLDDVKSALRREIGKEAFHSAAKPEELVRALLTSNEDEQRFMAFDYLLNAGDSQRNQAWLNRRLVSLVRDPKASQDVRVSALWVLKYCGPPNLSRQVAADLAGRHDTPDLGHAAATILLDGANESQLLAAFRSEARALREAAALQLVWPAHGEEVRREAAASLLRTAKAADEPPRYRGEAIEALSATAAFPDSHDALLELLDPRWWFFGAQGQHFLIHSLALVIGGLRHSGVGSDRAILESLRSQVARLRSGEREYVEWVLDNALGKDRPIFHDRVDPRP